MLKAIIRITLGIILLLALWQHQLILYGTSQAKGQLKVVMNSREIADVLTDSYAPDSIKQKLLLIQEIKKFTVDFLGFSETENYETYYDQQGKPILWVVTAAKPFAMEPKEWSFPFLGDVPYKGFFELGKAEDEERALERQQWDTNLRVVGGWSTLGWFRDPVLSNMLNESSGELANTIIHELTHGNLFVKDSVQFNENLASFFGDQGARLFLEHKYGLNSIEGQLYNRRQADQRKFTSHILNGAELLDELYKSQGVSTADNLRYGPKRSLLNEIIDSADTLNLYEKDRYILYLEKSKVNNAFFMSYLRYRADFGIFEKELEDKFKGDLKGYFQHLQQQYPSI